MFTRQTLRRLTTEKVFARGEELWAEGAVKKLSRPAPTRFSARVKGTYSYVTEAWLATGEVEFSCDCPYDFEGICKHAVALGLAILEKYGDDLNSAAGAAPPAANALPAAVTAAVTAAWASRSEKEKLKFLELALAKSDDLARQFLAYGGAAVPTEAIAAAAADPLESLTERLTDTFSALEFGEQFFETHSTYDSYDEGEALFTAAQEEIRAELFPFVAELLALARAGQLTLALRYWTTACAALYQIEEPADNDYGVMDEYGFQLLLQWNAELKTADWPAVLLAAVLPPAELKAALKWLTQHLADPPARWDNYDQIWLPLLLALADDPTAAPLLPKALEKAPFGPDLRARLQMHLALARHDDPAWAAAAETLLPTDASVAEQLLHFYTSQGDAAARLRVATEAFATWPDRFAGTVLHSFTPAQAPGLYRDALRHRALANHSLADFAVLRPLLTAAQISGFVKAAASRARSTRQGVGFAAELMAQEGETAALRRLAFDLEWPLLNPPAQAEILLTQLAKADPTPLMLELETRLPAYMMGRAGAKRGHDLYQRLARWLTIVRHAAPRLDEPVLRLSLALREEFPTLYGLRDALRGEGLLTNEPAKGKAKK